MDLRRPRFSLAEAIFFLVWWSAVLITGFAYWRMLASFRVNEACSASGLRTFFVGLANPRYYFAVFTIALTVFGALTLAKRSMSRWPWIVDARWPIITLVVGTFLLVTLIGCN